MHNRKLSLYSFWLKIKYFKFFNILNSIFWQFNKIKYNMNNFTKKLLSKPEISPNNSDDSLSHAS